MPSFAQSHNRDVYATTRRSQAGRGPVHKDSTIPKERRRFRVFYQYISAG